ncbi:ABC transporter substrate-binding protein [bacterium]|nr:ABC transporter substrate-binding protein [bacterium]MBU3955461.1 ABC transporter substrate-binding protein [bacterium]
MKTIIKSRAVLSIILCMIFCAFSAGAGEKFPERIVSLGPAITESLYLLKAQDRIIANTVYCLRPAEAANKEKIGTVLRADVEKIVSLKPDMVLATSLSRPEQIQIMKGVGLKVVSFPQLQTFEQLCRQFLELGKITGKSKEAEKIIKSVKCRVKRIKKKTGAFVRPKVFVQIGAKPLFAATGDSFINDFIELAGGINIASKVKTGFYSREQVIKSNPDVIIIVTMGIAGENEKKTWQKFKVLNAAKNNRIYVVDSYKMCSPTPEGFADTLEELVELFHPGHNKEERKKIKNEN